MMTPHEQKKILNAIQANPELKNCFLEMIETSSDEKNILNNCDDAEEAVIDIIHKTGRVLLQEWTEKKNKQAENNAYANPMIRPHVKKKLFGTQLSETSKY